jgi:hypothetical protein
MAYSWFALSLYEREAAFSILGVAFFAAYRVRSS